MTNTSLCSISSLARLQYLDLSDCRKITGSGLSHLPMLTPLDLHGCDEFTGCKPRRGGIDTKIAVLTLEWLYRHDGILPEEYASSYGP